MRTVMHRAVPLGVITAAAMLSAASQANPGYERKPGLWEVTSRQHTPGLPDMSKLMAGMSPAQRAQMEAAMKQHGVGLGAAPGSFRYCLTPERAKQETVPVSDPKMRCEHEMGPRQGDEMRFTVRCTEKDGGSLQGNGRLHELTPTSYALDMEMKVQERGETMQMSMSQRGRWVGADCQGLKPAK